MQKSVVAVMALVGFFSHANALTTCPELIKLRAETAEAAKQMTGVPTSDRCVAYTRFSSLWGEIFQYAKDNRKLCDVPVGLLGEIEKRHRDAVLARDSVCASRPAQPFPPEIIGR
jgi:hypothetical protein